MSSALVLGEALQAQSQALKEARRPFCGDGELRDVVGILGGEIEACVAQLLVLGSKCSGALRQLAIADRTRRGQRRRVATSPSIGGHCCLSISMRSPVNSAR